MPDRSIIMLGRDLVEETANRFDCTLEDIEQGNRLPHVTRARYAAAWVLRERNRDNPTSYPSIGRLVGCTHSSAMRGIERANELRSNDFTFRLETDRLLRLAQGKAPRTMTEPRTHRGWRIQYDPKPIPDRRYDWIASHPDYEASYEGPEDGWVGSHPILHGATEAELRAEIDAWFDEQMGEAA